MKLSKLYDVKNIIENKDWSYLKLVENFPEYLYFYIKNIYENSEIFDIFDNIVDLEEYEISEYYDVANEYIMTNFTSDDKIKLGKFINEYISDNEELIRFRDEMTINCYSYKDIHQNTLLIHSTSSLDDAMSILNNQKFEYTNDSFYFLPRHNHGKQSSSNGVIFGYDLKHFIKNINGIKTYGEYHIICKAGCLSLEYNFMERVEIEHVFTNDSINSDLYLVYKKDGSYILMDKNNNKSNYKSLNDIYMDFDKLNKKMVESRFDKHYDIVKYGVRIVESFDNFIESENKQKLINDIKSFIDKYAGVRPDYDPEYDDEDEKYTSPDATELLYAMNQLKQYGYIKYMPHSSWLSGGYKTIDNNGESIHNDIINRCKLYKKG